MGWAYGVVSGRTVGYSVKTKCEQPGCREKIDRGLAFACGGTHGENEVSCAGYFCPSHLFCVIHWETGNSLMLCKSCCNYNDGCAYDEAEEFGMTLGEYWHRVEERSEEHSEEKYRNTGSAA